MKKILLAGIVVFSFTALNAQALKTEKDSLSYAIGVTVAQNMKKQGVTEVDPNIFLRAVQESLAGTTAQMDFNLANKLVTEYSKKKAVAVGKTYLDNNAKRSGVTVLPSGLQYEVLVDGTGEIPKSTDKVKVHYTGTLIDGTVFDSSVQRGQPATFPVTGVIKGWVEALQLMKTGSKWKLFIPYQLAYGERGAGGQIGPYATLVFEVELLEIVK
ncbi:MAG: FKBP-type peptidyl-prolyl cis-trans isomerase [Saprospiraceae bacterium]|jgi:FKBP-type peptidyl-prolyl cis-trans isomerase FklB|nr:FKBP-type peptidyl-prolyl cis-trans isomerase [Saprospiraceae bacterium]